MSSSVTTAGSVISADVLVVGGGVVGLTTALQLAERGVSVVLVDRRGIGHEASWAGAGMLPPGNATAATTPEARLRSYSAERWQQLSRSLADRTGIDNGYRICGAVELRAADAEAWRQQVQAWNDAGLRVESLQQSELAVRFPAVHPEFRSAVFLPDFAQVRNPRHLKALTTACRMAGVRIVERVEHLQLLPQGSFVRAAASPQLQFQADRICLCAGAWSAALLAPLEIQIPVKPIRGQMVQLQLAALPFHSIIELGRRYLVPRPDGLILAGSTEEDVGFVKQNTAEAVENLLKFATALVPALSQAAVVRMWAGLRPGTPDELPLIGRVPGWENLFVGAGHFRSGLQMSPGTASILADLLEDRSPEISLDGLCCDRFFPGAVH